MDKNTPHTVKAGNTDPDYYDSWKKMLLDFVLGYLGSGLPYLLVYPLSMISGVLSGIWVLIASAWMIAFFVISINKRRRYIIYGIILAFATPFIFALLLFGACLMDGPFP